MRFSVNSPGLELFIISDHHLWSGPTYPRLNFIQSSVLGFGISFKHLTKAPSTPIHLGLKTSPQAHTDSPAGDWEASEPLN